MSLFFLLLLTTALVSIVGTIRAILRDDRGPVPPPGSHRVDADFLPPAALSSRR